ncbi:FAD-dependent oxidoreductase [Schaalia sp. lx-260]|uniref:FAD-dependent oxidoreductase n=1 Tax=Schaalia sp. lx-260 TaxID=2899082 RepID=UPI001E334345|nr:FAD-dependent oxidoreductase [Schaalia sp. lx-260]
MSTVHVAVVGAGPAGIYASDILSKSGLDVSIDLFERLPAPYGLVRYGVAPDHPRIKQIITALYRILQRGDIQLLGNVEVGRDITIDDLRDHYDAIIIASGADRDAPLDIPGINLPESYGAADFVSWYDGHPDYPREWPLNAREIAVIGVGNVALDVARVLAKHAEDMLVTEIPENVAKTLAENPVTDVHVFGRRGPAQVKFTPLELRELGHVPDVDIIVSEEDFEFDEGSEDQLRSSNQQRQVVKTLTAYASADPEEHVASRRIHIHLFQSPIEIVPDDKGHVRALRTERMELVGDGTVRGTGVMTTWPVQAVYRAVGYYSSPIPGMPFDTVRGIIPNDEGRVRETSDPDSATIDGLYATGWIKRGPVGLIGSTKSDAQQTIAHLVEDAQAGRLRARGTSVGHEAIVKLLEERNIEYTTWDGWELLDEYEQSLGASYGDLPGDRGSRERIKVVSRRAMTDISRGQQVDPAQTDLIGRMGEMGVPSAPERFDDYTGPQSH